MSLSMQQSRMLLWDKPKDPSRISAGDLTSTKNEATISVCQKTLIIASNHLTKSLIACSVYKTSSVFAHFITYIVSATWCCYTYCQVDKVFKKIELMDNFLIYFPQTFWAFWANRKFTFLINLELFGYLPRLLNAIMRLIKCVLTWKNCQKS